MDSRMVLVQLCAPSEEEGDSATFKMQGKKGKLVVLIFMSEANRAERFCGEC